MNLARNAAFVPKRLIKFACLVFLILFIVQVSLSRKFPGSTAPTRGPVFPIAEPWPRVEGADAHPIRELMRAADGAFESYDINRSKTFQQTVEKYRQTHGRHPPPLFDEWYKFARKRQVHNVDDFQQIHDDFRPFWGVQPSELRHYAAHGSDVVSDNIATISIRDGRVFEALSPGWRSADFLGMLTNVARYLPDMDIPMNRMDQPRVIVPWESVQVALKVEEVTRSLDNADVLGSFTAAPSGLCKRKPRSVLSSLLNALGWQASPSDHEILQEDPRRDYGWFHHASKPFMDLASQACPPDSYARNLDSASHLQRAEASYKHSFGNFITNFNLSSDLCTVGPQLSHSHGLLYAASSMQATQKLIPVFSECKTSVNNDILFPASIYYKQDDHYLYRSGKDPGWDDKRDVMFWRGSTSGGNAYESMPESWHSMHRQRLVLLTNSTEMGNATSSILATANADNSTYTSHNISAAPLSAEHTDIGFVKRLACLPNCSFYDETFSMLPWTPFSTTFGSKYLIDIDGHSFSGRWRAYLQSRSLGMKATIIREWHDSRLWAWRHFVPVDNGYRDLYNLLAYFTGYEDRSKGLRVPRHDYEGFEIAQQGRDWAAKVLRKEDIDIYLFRLLLEYARLCDDNRDRIGFVGDGGVEMEAFDREYPAVD